MGEREQQAGGSDENLKACKWERREDGKWTHPAIETSYGQEDAERMQRTVDELTKRGPWPGVDRAS